MGSAIAILLFLVPFVSLLLMPGWRSLWATAAVFAVAIAGHWAWGIYRTGGDRIDVGFLTIIVTPWIVSLAAGVAVRSALLWWRGRMQAAGS